MTYKVETTENFRKEAKNLIRKYPSLRHELQQLETQLSVNPLTGTPLGNDIYKIRTFHQIQGERETRRSKNYYKSYSYQENRVFVLYLFER